MANIQWIKVSTEILHNRKITALRYEKNGNEIILLWFYLMVLAGKVNDGGKVYFTETIPYDVNKLHTEFRLKRSIIEQGLKYFQSNLMIELDQSGVIRILNWEEYQNVDQMELIRQQNRLRQQRYKERHAKPNVNITQPITLDNAVEKNRIEKNRIEEIRKENNQINKELNIYAKELVSQRLITETEAQEINDQMFRVFENKEQKLLRFITHLKAHNVVNLTVIKQWLKSYEDHKL